MTTRLSSPFHLTQDQIQFFDDNGYLILRQWITGDMLRHAQAAGDAWIRQGSTGPRVAEVDYRFTQRENRTVMNRVDYIHAKDEPASLELLGSPQVLAVAESLNGTNFVPTYEAMVIKMEGEGVAVPWHQDALFTRRYRVWNFDLYLDASKRDTGALRVLPGTQKKIHDACQVQAEVPFDRSDLLVVEMEPGDVVIHDDMVLHGSPGTQGCPLRRTIYLEFRSVEQIRDEGPWDMDWVQQRLQLVPLAMKRYRQRYPDAPQFTWNVVPAYRPAVTNDEATELRIVHKKHSPASFCSAGSSLKVNTLV